MAVGNYRRNLCAATLLAALLSSLGWPLAAQAPPPTTTTTSTAIEGEVIDHAGSVYEGATIQLQPSHAPLRTARSDSDGQFHFSDIPPGPFVLTVSARGFTVETVTGTIAANQNLALPSIVLTPGSVTEVRVSSSSPAEIATMELHLEEQQRVLGIVPNFYVVYDRNAPPLSARQKFHLATYSLIDPFNLAITGAVAGYKQGDNDLKGYGQGTKGYALRYGALYGNGFVDTMLGGALLPSIFHQDPRYFYKGVGTTRSRFKYAVANAFVCKGDNGRWQMNYSSLLGDAAAAGIANLYYPAGDRGSGSDFVESIALDKAASAIGNVFQEFVVRHFMHKPPIYGATP
jgi:hypothetical protein